MVLSGRMGVKAGGRERVLEAGEEAVVPPGVPHTFWNASRSGEVLHHVVELRPALQFGGGSSRRCSACSGTASSWRAGRRTRS